MFTWRWSITRSVSERAPLRQELLLDCEFALLHHGYEDVHLDVQLKIRSWDWMTRRGPSQPRTFCDVPARCGEVGRDDLERSLPTPNVL